MTLRSLRAPVLFLSLAMLVSLTGTGPARSGSDSNRMVAAARKRPPNILLIVTDDQRKTPLWDMPATRRYFQKGGVEYTNAFVTTPLCCPSRSSIMTGQYVHNHGVHSNGSGARLDVSDTIQRYLNKAGYRTALIGKYLNAWGTWKPPQFWDRFAYFLPWGNKYYKATFNIDGKVKRVRPHSNRFMANHSLRLLEDFERSDNSPWFMYIAPKAPHKPFLPAPGDRRADVHGFEGNPAVKESELDDKPPWVRQCWDHCGRLGTGQSRARQQQRTLLSVDDLVSDVFKQMDTLDEDRQTLAFFISDNGYMWGEHGMIGKSQPYDQSVGVPFFARWPGRLRAGSKDGRLVANIDIAPMIMQAAGIGSSHVVDGHSLLGETSRDYLLLESLDTKKDAVPWASIRTRTEQYTEYYYSKSEGVQFREYYDLAQDPWQLENLLFFRDAPALARSTDLAALLATARSCAGETCP
jgi:arylsulfatase A-like enzyme